MWQSLLMPCPYPIASALAGANCQCHFFAWGLCRSAGIWGIDTSQLSTNHWELGGQIPQLPCPSDGIIRYYTQVQLSMVGAGFMTPFHQLPALLCLISPSSLQCVSGFASRGAQTKAIGHLLCSRHWARGFIYIMCRSGRASVKKGKRTTLPVHEGKSWAFASEQTSVMTQGKAIQLWGQARWTDVIGRPFPGHESSDKRKTSPTAGEPGFRSTSNACPLSAVVCPCWVHNSSAKQFCQSGWGLVGPHFANLPLSPGSAWIHHHRLREGEVSSFLPGKAEVNSS